MLASIRMKVEDKEFVPIALNEFSSSWDPFVCGVKASEKLPSFEKLWDDFIEEETKLEIVSARVKEI